MSRFTNQERARVFAESQRLLQEDKAPTPPPAPAPEPLVLEDDMDRWRREARESDTRRAEAKAELRRQAADDPALAGFATIGSRLDDLEQRVASIEQRLESIDTLADGAATFSSSVVAKMDEWENLTTRLSATLDTLRAVQDRQTEALRDRLAATEAAGARESAFLSRQLSEARRELDALVGQLNSERDHERTNARITHLTESVNNVLSFAQKIPDGAA
jgi:chromosome segregation ATPase